METAQDAGNASAAAVRSYVASNVVRLRSERQLTVREMSRRLEGLGHRLYPSTISKIEQGQRSVDVEDLVALSVVLGVHPAALLVPPISGDTPVHLLGNLQAPAWKVWAWMHGATPLETDDAIDWTQEVEAFQRRALPYDLYARIRSRLSDAARGLGIVLAALQDDRASTVRARNLARARHYLEEIRFELDDLEGGGED